MRWEETEGIRLPGNWKGGGAARDVRLLRLCGGGLMRLAAVCFNTAAADKPSGAHGAPDWLIPAEQTPGLKSED